MGTLRLPEVKMEDYPVSGKARIQTQASWLKPLPFNIAQNCVTSKAGDDTMQNRRQWGEQWAPVTGGGFPETRASGTGTAESIQGTTTRGSSSLGLQTGAEWRPWARWGFQGHSGWVSSVCLWQWKGWARRGQRRDKKRAQHKAQRKSNISGMKRGVNIPIAPLHMESSQPRDQTWVSGTGRRTLYHWVTSEPLCRNNSLTVTQESRGICLLQVFLLQLYLHLFPFFFIKYFLCGAFLKSLLTLL